jgi:hypothetical protein
MRSFTFIGLALYCAFMVAACDPYEECISAGGTPQTCAHLKTGSAGTADGGASPPATRFYTTWEADTYREALKIFVGPQSWIRRAIPGAETYIWSGDAPGAITGIYCNNWTCAFSCVGNEGLSPAVDRAVSGMLPVTGIPADPGPGYHHGVLAVSLEINGAARIVHLLCAATSTDITDVEINPLQMVATFVALPPGGRVEQRRQIMPAEGAVNMSVAYHPEMQR